MKSPWGAHSRGEGVKLHPRDSLYFSAAARAALSAPSWLLTAAAESAHSPPPEGKKGKINLKGEKNRRWEERLQLAPRSRAFGEHGAGMCPYGRGRRGGRQARREVASEKIWHYRKNKPKHHYMEPKALALPQHCPVPQG